MSSKGMYYTPRKSSRAMFLISLLIIPSFPEQIVCNNAFRYHSSIRRGDNTVSRELMNGFSRKIYPTPTAYSSMIRPSPTEYRHRPMPKFNFPQKQRYTSQGMVILQQAPSLPPPRTGFLLPKRTLPAKSKKKQSITYPIAMKTRCPGRKNLLDDIGLLSLVTAIMSSSFGMYTILVNSMTSNNIGIVSGFMTLVLWVPSTIITLFNLSGDKIYLLSNLVNNLSFINSMYGFMGVIFGTADVLASAAGESVGVISFILSVIATFPDFLDSIIEYLYRVGNRKRLHYFVENYGCSVPTLFRHFGKPLYTVVNDFLVASIGMKGLE